MTIYILKDKKRFLQGLPNMPELDDATLNAEGKKLLATAVSIGIYAEKPTAVVKPVYQTTDEPEAIPTPKEAAPVIPAPSYKKKA